MVAVVGLDSRLSACMYHSLQKRSVTDAGLVQVEPEPLGDGGDRSGQVEINLEEESIILYCGTDVEG